MLLMRSLLLRYISIHLQAFTGRSLYISQQILYKVSGKNSDLHE